MNGWQAIQAIRDGKIVRCLETGSYFWRNGSNILCGSEPNKNERSYSLDMYSSLLITHYTFEIYKPEPSELDKAIEQLILILEKNWSGITHGEEDQLRKALKEFAAAIIAEAKK